MMTRWLFALLLLTCGGGSPRPERADVTPAADADCGATVKRSVHLASFACSNREVVIAASGIGNAVLDVTPGPLELTVSAWRLEGFAVRSGGKALCLPELEACSPAAGTASLERNPSVEGPWTWTVHLDDAPTPLEVAWIDAYR